MTDYFYHFIIDIETKSTQPNAAMASIGVAVIEVSRKIIDGAKELSRHMLEDTFFRRVTTNGPGRHFCVDNALWWSQQRPEIQAKSLSEGNGLTGGDAMSDLHDYFRSIAGDNPFWVWAEPAAFDIPILEGWAIEEGAKALIPWKYNQVKCLMTLNHFRRGIDPQMADLGGVEQDEATKHDPEEDARFSGRLLMSFLHDNGNELVFREPFAEVKYEGPWMEVCDG